jgi:hypothetical protein
MKGFFSFLTKLWGKLSNVNAGAESKFPSVTFSKAITWTGHEKKMIELTLARFEYTSKSTLGAFYNGSKYQCNMLEDAIRKVKVYGQTAIPCGRYRVDFTWSGRFNRQLPILVNVPLFSGIRIHSGNTAEDTDGCPLPGFGIRRDGENLAVYRSIEAMEKIILPIFAGGDTVYINILGGYSKDEMTKGAA